MPQVIRHKSAVVKLTAKMGRQSQKFHEALVSDKPLLRYRMCAHV